MNPLYIVIGFMSFLVFVCLVLIFLILTQKSRLRKKEQKIIIARKHLFKKYIDNEPSPYKISSKFFFEALIDVDEQIKLDDDTRSRIIDDICNQRFLKRKHRQLNSMFAYRRKIAVFYLGRTRKTEAIDTLEKRFKKEKNEAVKYHIVLQFRGFLNKKRLNLVMESLQNQSLQYQKKVANILGNYYQNVQADINEYFVDYREEIVRALLHIASFHSDASLNDYMLEVMKSLDKNSPFNETITQTFKETILLNLSEHSPEILQDSWHLNHEDSLIKRHAIYALSRSPKIASLRYIINTIDQSEMDTHRINALSRMVYDNRKWLDVLLEKFESLDQYRKQKLIKVFSHRIDYIILKTTSKESSPIKEILALMIEEKYLEPIIDFLNQNKNAAIEDKVVAMINPYLVNDDDVLKEFQTYLNQNTLNKLGLIKTTPVPEIREKPPVEKRKVRWIIKWLLLNIMIAPTIFIIRHYNTFFTMTNRERFELFTLDINRYLVIYFVAINTIYAILLIFAFRASKKQANLAKTKKYSLLFTKSLLPGISIIAPAYNEEKSIIDSVTSLLNLKYPQYDVIVVNDGSKDETLSTLINHFKLERKHPFFKNTLGTKKLRGVYVTKKIPNLIVIDKQNGGKADALNMGINASKHEYVCGIDADSVLESDALLKMASITLDDTTPFLALGGNIYPANGFTFNRGEVDTKGLGKQSITRFQTIEYLRAFTSGRIGWSELRSLLIISGAFGLFQRKALMDTGGYLTSNTVHKKDTVGEDMELVVRLTYQALKEKRPYRVAYVFNAFCYTELPSDYGTLFKQRNRWQRGLIDILSYHRQLFFNPKYKQVGMIGYPYFFTFEFMGPFFELQGYLFLVIALVMGLLSPALILGIFSASVIYGMVISLSSLLMTEREALMLNKKETFILIAYAIIENFGYRQIMSLHRVLSTFSALRESGKWGTQQRKGFQTK